MKGQNSHKIMWIFCVNAQDYTSTKPMKSDNFNFPFFLNTLTLCIEPSHVKSLIAQPPVSNFCYYMA